jgi:hypothetical protein
VEFVLGKLLSPSFTKKRKTAMYANLGHGQAIALDEPTFSGIELLYSHEYVAGARGALPNVADPNVYNYCFGAPINATDPMGEMPPIKPRPGYVRPRPAPAPTKGTNVQGLIGGYCITYGCTSKKDRLKPIPGVATPAKNPLIGVGPPGGGYAIYPFPTTPAGAVGGGGAQTCIVLVIRCKGIVAVYHFSVGDEPGYTLSRYSWPKQPPCDAIICGGDNSDQSNCLADDVIEAAKTHGFNLVGVSGNSGCGVDATGKWFEFG